jgi:hypothetical protein
LGDDRDSLDGCLLAALLTLIMLLILIMAARWVIGL